MKNIFIHTTIIIKSLKASRCLYLIYYYDFVHTHSHSFENAAHVLVRGAGNF